MDLQELTTDLYRLRLPTDRAYLLNSYLLLGPDGVTIVDTGWPGSAPLVASALARLGRRRADVERIVLTHFHDDHVGSAAEIASWSPSTVVAGRDDAPFIRGTAPGPWPELTPAEQALNPPLPGTVSPPPPCRVHLEVDDGDVFDLPGGAVVVHVPGHTPGSIALHLPQQGVLLTGDVLAGVNGEVIVGAFNTNRNLLHASISKLERCGARIAGFGHGEAIFPRRRSGSLPAPIRSGNRCQRRNRASKMLTTTDTRSIDTRGM